MIYCLAVWRYRCTTSTIPRMIMPQLTRFMSQAAFFSSSVTHVKLCLMHYAGYILINLTLWIWSAVIQTMNHNQRPKHCKHNKYSWHSSPSINSLLHIYTSKEECSLITLENSKFWFFEERHRELLNCTSFNHKIFGDWMWS